jgi:hypothetical protein
LSDSIALDHSLASYLNLILTANIGIARFSGLPNVGASIGSSMFVAAKSSHAAKLSTDVRLKGMLAGLLNT